MALNFNYLYNISNIFQNPCITNNESFTLSNLGDGEIYSFKITDDAGSSKTISNTYLGNEKPSYEQIQAEKMVY